MNSIFQSKIWPCLTIILFVSSLALSSLATVAPVAAQGPPLGPQRFQTFGDMPPGLAPTIAQALANDLPASFHPQAIEVGYQADNPTHDLTTTFGPAGPRMAIAGETWGLTLTGLGRGRALRALPAADLVADGPRLEYRRNNLTEWYLNTHWGLEQGFTIQAPPTGKGDLVLALATNGSLQASLQDDATLLLANAAGQTVARYTGLHAYDANGQPLPAHLSLSPRSVSIVVDDSAATYPLTIDPWVQKAKLLPTDGAKWDYFGDSVAVSGDTVVVGAWGDDYGVENVGSAYVFVKPEGSWSETLHQSAKLRPSDGAQRDEFGFSVAISGDTVVVGSSYDSDNGEWSGSAYVFVEPEGGWSGTLTESAKLLPSDGAAGDRFGYSVAIGGDTIAVGAWGDDDNGDIAGSAYVFVEPVGGWSGTLNQSAKLLAAGGAEFDYFGDSVAISGDTVVVGADGDDDNGNNSGSAYVFVEPVGGWSGTLNQSAKLLAADGAAEDAFGGSVATGGDGGAVVVGAAGDDDNGDGSGAAYVFVEPEGGWSGTVNESAKLLAADGAAGDGFGECLAVSDDASSVVVGVQGDDDKGDDAGSAYVFVEPGEGWSGTLDMSAKLLAADGVAEDWFGASVAISGDIVVVGAFGNDDNDDDSGSAYVFEGSPSGLAIAKDVTPVTAVPGDTLTYTLSFEAAAVDVRLWDPLPSNVALISGSLSGSVSPPVVYSPTARAILWEGRPPTDTVSTVNFQVTFELSGTGWPSSTLAVVNIAWLTDMESGQNVSATAIVNGWRVYLPVVMR